MIEQKFSLRPTLQSIEIVSRHKKRTITKNYQIIISKWKNSHQAYYHITAFHI